MKRRCRTTCWVRLADSLHSPIPRGFRRMGGGLLERDTFAIHRDFRQQGGCSCCSRGWFCFRRMVRRENFVNNNRKRKTTMARFDQYIGLNDWARKTVLRKEKGASVRGVRVRWMGGASASPGGPTSRWRASRCLAFSPVSGRTRSQTCIATRCPTGRCMRNISRPAPGPAVRCTISLCGMKPESLFLSHSGLTKRWVLTHTCFV